MSRRRRLRSMAGIISQEQAQKIGAGTITSSCSLFPAPAFCSCSCLVALAGFHDAAIVERGVDVGREEPEPGIGTRRQEELRVNLFVQLFQVVANGTSHEPGVQL